MKLTIILKSIVVSTSFNEHSFIAFLCCDSTKFFFKTHWWACRTSSLLSADGKFQLSVHSLISFVVVQKQSHNVPKRQPRRLPFCPPPPMSTHGGGAKRLMTFQTTIRGSVKVENKNWSPRALKQWCLCSYVKPFLSLRYRDQSRGFSGPKPLWFSNTMSYLKSFCNQFNLSRQYLLLRTDILQKTVQRWVPLI